MKISINSKLNLSPDAQVLLHFFLKNQDLDCWWRNRALKELKDNGYVLSSYPKIILSTTKCKGLYHDVEEWIEDYRALFKGIKPGSMGDKKACTLKMKDFLRENDYSKDQILIATKRYLNTTNPLYIQQADYFIYKQSEKVKQSKLRSFCEEIERLPDEENKSIDFFKTL